VTCMFALQFFFKDEGTLRTLLKMVAVALKPGGYFLGCTVDGSSVLDLLKGKDSFEGEMLQVKRIYKENVVESSFE